MWIDVWVYMWWERVIPLSTAIGLRKYRIPSDLRSQAEYRLVSTTVGDHVGILGAVVFAFLPGGSEKWWEMQHFRVATGNEGVAL